MRLLSLTRSACLTLGLLVLCTPLHAGDKKAATPFLPGYNRFYLDSKEKGDAVRGGTLLLGELGCVQCHKAEPEIAKSLQTKQAPILDGVGSRIRKTFFKNFLFDPQTAKPHTLMPNALGGLPSDEREKAAEALAHYLASTGVAKQQKPQPKAVAAGKSTYHQLGCVACHGTRDGKGDQAKISETSIPLGDLKAKYTLTSLTAFLENPHTVRPSGRMPQLLNVKQANDVASYLLQGIGIDLAGANMKYSYYEGAWQNLPDFAKLKAKASGIAPAFDIKVAPRAGNMALVFEGFLDIRKEGQYKFWLTSDDGSKLWIDDKLVVNNDGVHPPAVVNASTFLKTGPRPIKVAFFNAGGGAELRLEFQGAGVPKQELHSFVRATENEPKVAKKEKSKTEFILDETLVAKGKELFQSVGCASCHQLKESDKPLPSKLEAPALAKLRAGQGCLSSTPGKNVPHFTLPAKAKSDIAAALASLSAGAPKLTKEGIIHRTFVTFNCYACHERDKVGGPEDIWNAHFTTTQPEMGDEARIPPSLTGVGAKMQPAYLKHIFASGVNDRPYMHTQMPKFGIENVGHLIDDFAALDKLTAIEKVSFGVTHAKAKADARYMVGGLAIGCVKCHTFNGNKAEGVQGMDMVLMPKRVQRDWFHHYLLTPMALRPGTRMPEAWPKGVSPLPKILGGDTAKQIEAIYIYLADGKAAQLPLGINKKFIPLVAEGEAIIYRNFIQGAGARAIGVGYPEQANLAFDANDLRIAMIWQGAFIDAARHWLDRGVGYQPPLGDNILAFPSGPSVAILAKEDEPWPTKALKETNHFKGYRLTKDQRPTFLYEVSGIHVEDFPNPAPAKTGFPHMKRTLTVSADKAPANAYFRAAFGKKIEAEKDGWYSVDGLWRVRVTGAEPRIRASGAGNMELLVPLSFKDGKTEVTQEISW